MRILTFLSKLLFASWAQFMAASALACISAGSLRAEGVVGGGSFVQGGKEADASLVGNLTDESLLATTATVEPTVQVAVPSPRTTSPRERIESKVGGDLFRNMRLALPLVTRSVVGEQVDVPATTDLRPMSGPMVGIRPRPQTLGTTLGR